MAFEFPVSCLPTSLTPSGADRFEWPDRTKPLRVPRLGVSALKLIQ
jgi:hypothetical protein